MSKVLRVTQEKQARRELLALPVKPDPRVTQVTLVLKATRVLLVKPVLRVRLALKASKEFKVQQVQPVKLALKDLLEHRVHKGLKDLLDQLPRTLTFKLTT